MKEALERGVLYATFKFGARNKWAILIGLKSPVVKSHGATDSIGFSNSLSVCEKIIKGRLIDKIKENLE